MRSPHFRKISLSDSRCFDRNRYFGRYWQVFQEWISWLALIKTREQHTSARRRLILFHPLSFPAVGSLDLTQVLGVSVGLAHLPLSERCTMTCPRVQVPTGSVRWPVSPTRENSAPCPPLGAPWPSWAMRKRGRGPAIADELGFLSLWGEDVREGWS